MQILYYRRDVKLANRILIIFCILLYFFLYGCLEDQANVNKLVSDNDKEILSDVFITTDSCYLNYPLEYFPSIIYDVAIYKNDLYITSRSKQYPVVKFRTDGSFDKAIGRIGGGPGEYISSPTKISLQNNILAILLPELNKIILYKDDIFLMEKYFPKKYRFSDLDFINDSTLVVSGYGSSEKHIFLMDINLELLSTYIDIPDYSKIGSFISTHGWGIQAIENCIVSHLLYPNLIIEAEYNSFERISNINSITLNLEKFQMVDSTIAKNIYSKFTEVNRFEFFESFSKIYWLINIKEYFIGTYFYYSSAKGEIRKRKKNLRLFVIHNNSNIFERDLDRKVGFLIPHKNKIISCQYKKKVNDIKIKLSLLVFDENKFLK
jgi:hypothetical protein